MTFTSAWLILKAQRMTINRTKAHTSSPEYRVTEAPDGLNNVALREAYAYYTEDLQDAVNTGIRMAAQRDGR